MLSQTIIQQFFHLAGVHVCQQHTPPPCPDPTVVLRAKLATALNRLTLSLEELNVMSQAIEKLQAQVGATVQTCKDATDLIPLLSAKGGEAAAVDAAADAASVALKGATDALSAAVAGAQPAPVVPPVAA